jgi:hypothetical protein
MPQLAHLLEVAGRQRSTQRLEFLAAVLHECRHEIFEILGDGNGDGLSHQTIIKC